MFKTKLKKFICTTLAVTLAFGGIQFQPMVVNAETVSTSEEKYSCLADAVEALYDGDTSVVDAYDLERFDDNYEYSITKVDYNKKHTFGEVGYKIPYSMIWLKKHFYASADDKEGFDSATRPGFFSYKKYDKNLSIFLNDIETGKKIEWDYDIVHISHFGNNYNDKDDRYDGYVRHDEYIAVNIRPSHSVLTASNSASGSVTLPAYINSDRYGKVKCVELGDGAFLKDTDLTEVHIPDTYERICAYAFTGCPALEKVDFVATKETDSGVGYTIDTTVSDEQSIENSNIHMLGTGAFAECTSLKEAVLPKQLTEGYMYYDENSNVIGFAGVNSNEGDSVGVSYESGTYLTGKAQDVCNYGIRTSLVGREGDPLKNTMYYIGQGIYQGCTSLSSVSIGGVNPFIPAFTFKGCTSLSNLSIEDTAKRIYFGVESFEGTNVSSLALNSESLENVIFGEHAFKDCSKLKEVRISCDIDRNALREGIGYMDFGTGDVFENSFAEGSTFKYSYTGDDRLTLNIPDGMFRDCKNLKSIEFNNVDNLVIGRNAYFGVGCTDLNLSSNYMVTLLTSSLYGLTNTDTVTFSGNRVDIKGEPFSSGLPDYRNCINSPIKNLIFDCSVVDIGKEKVTYSTEIDGSEVTSSYTSNAIFYGLGDSTVVKFTDSVKSISGTINNGTLIHSNTDGEYKVRYPNGYGEVKKIIFEGYNIKINNDVGNFTSPTSSLFEKPVYSDDIYNLSIYASGNSYKVLNTIVSSIDSEAISLHPYVTSITDSEIEWVNTETDFDPSRVNDGKGVQVQYADGTSEYIPYSKEEQLAGATDGKLGYVITNLDDIKSSIKEEEATANLEVSYWGTKGTIVASIVFKKPISMNVETREVVEGTIPTAKDVTLSSIVYNDGATEESPKDDSEISVKLESGDTYKLGENIVYVTYKGYTKRVKINAKPDEVVSLSAIQCNKVIYTGDTVSKGSIKVCAEYLSGDIVEDFDDYEILNSLVKDDKWVLEIKSSNGVVGYLDLEVIPVKEKSISVEYTGSEVPEGSELNKDNFTVILRYSNGNFRVLSSDEFKLVHDAIKIGSNKVTVVFKDLSQVVYVTGVERPLVSDSPSNSSNPSTSNEPATPDAVPSTPNVATPSGTSPSESTPSGTAPSGATPVGTTPSSNTPSADTTPEIGGTSSPTANASTSPTATASSSDSPMPTGKAPNSGVSTGGSVTASPSPMKNNSSTSIKITLGVGEKFKTSSSSLTSPVLFSLSDENIAVISKTGVITAKGVGTTKIVLTDSTGSTRIYDVTVKKAPKTVKVNFKKKKLKKGKTARIKVSFAKGYYSYSRKFSSSNKKVATVTSKGIIKAKKKGTCKITVKAFNGKKAVIKVIVK